MPVFQGVAPRHTILTSSCVIPLWDSATAHSPSGKELNPSSQEDTRFSGRCTLTYRFSLHPASSLFGTQQQLTHPPVKSSSFHLCPASSLFGTQQQLTHPPVKSSTLPLRKMPVFQGVAPRHTILTSSCVIPLWDSATAHSPSGKGLNPSSQEDTRFSGRCTLTYRFSLHPASSLFGTQQQLTHPPVKSSSFHLWKNHVSLGLLFC